MKSSNNRKREQQERSAEKTEKLERIPELPTELNVNISPQEFDLEPAEQRDTKGGNAASSRQSEQHDLGSDYRNRDQMLDDAPRAQANSRNRQIDREPSQSQTQESKSFGMSYNGSMKYSGTGGTGGPNGSLSFKKHSPSKILGDYQMIMVNKAF